MSKIFDYILSRLFIFAFFVVILLIFIPVIWYNLAISGFLTILISLIIKVSKRKKSKRISYKGFELHCITKGTDYILELLSSAMPSYNFTSGEGVLLGKTNDVNIAIMPAIKFGAVGNDEVLKLHAKAKSLRVDKLYFIAREIDRKCQLIMHNYSKEVVFTPLSVVYKMLKTKKLLPEIAPTSRDKRSFSTEIFDVIFARVNVKRFLFVAIVLFLMSLLIPFTTYYITLGAINIALAIVCMVRNRTQSFYGKYGVFDEQIKLSIDANKNNSSAKSSADNSDIIPTEKKNSTDDKYSEQDE